MVIAVLGGFYYLSVGGCLDISIMTMEGTDSSLLHRTCEIVVVVARRRARIAYNEHDDGKRKYKLGILADRACLSVAEDAV